MKKFKPKSPKSKMNDPTLTHMRNVAYNDYRIHADKTMNRSERMRDDEGMLQAAEAKRQRKAAKAAALLKAK